MVTDRVHGDRSQKVRTSSAGFSPSKAGFSPSCAGFSLIELVLVVALVAVIAAIAVPRFDANILGKVSSMAAARELAGDLRLCRTKAVTEASTNPSGFAIKMTGSSPYEGYKLVNRGTGKSVVTKTFADGITAKGHSEFRFGPLGSLVGGSGTKLTLTGGGKDSHLNVTAANGSVRITQ